MATQHADGVPTTIEAMLVSALPRSEKKEWLEGLMAEVQQHIKHGSMGPKLRSEPDGYRAIPFGCILKKKRCGKRKVRGVIKGWRMQQGVDFNETFAPVPSMTTIRLMLALATKFDWEIKQGDVNTAFLGSDTDTVVIIKVPYYFDLDWIKQALADLAAGKEIQTPREKFFYRKVLKGIPGMPQCPRLWYRKSNKVYTGEGLVQSKTDPALYYCKTRKLFLVVWGDDLFLFFPTVSLNPAHGMWDNLRKKLDLDDWQDIDDCLGAKISRDRPNRRLTISQEAASRKLLQRSGMDKATHADTPMAPSSKLSKAQCPTAGEAKVMTHEQQEYRSLIASFIWLVSWTRPDLAYAVSRLCRYMHNPGEAHQIALKRLLRHLF